MNLKCSSSYRAYNKVLPAFLWNRPRDVVSHCMEKISLAEEIDCKTIELTDDEKGIFNVTSQSNSPGPDTSTQCSQFLGPRRPICRLELAGAQPASDPDFIGKFVPRCVKPCMYGLFAGHPGKAARASRRASATAA